MREDMSYQRDETVFSGMVRIGIVTAVDRTKKLCRVHFQDMDMQSAWLPVLQRIGGGVSVVPDGEHTHEIAVHDTYSGGGSGEIEQVPDHRHAGTGTGVWMPKVNDQVLVLYEPIREGRGFVLGGISTWQ